MRELLQKSAEQLTVPPAAAVEEFGQKQEKLAAKGNELFGSRSDVEKLVGEENLQMAEDNNRNFARFMASLFANYDPNVFVETVLWVYRTYRCHGFHTTYWAANLNLWTDLIKEELSDESYKAIYPFYEWLIVNIPKFTKITDECVDYENH